MGTVYEALDERTKSPRALKVMHPHLMQDADMRVRFAQEARIVGEIESDHIVRVLDAGIDESTGAPFLAMELLRGDDLGQRLKRRGPLPPEEVVLYLHQAALALDKTHVAGVVHRDMKPENLFVTRRDDGTACVKILDFGVAKLVQGHGGGAGTRSVGTPLYMAPEQILGHSSIGPRTDIYALGHVAYTLLVGKAYWREEATSKDALLPLLSRVSAGAAEPPSVRSARWNGPSLSLAFDEWFFRATAKDPENRFESASMAIGALSEALRRPRNEVTQPLPNGIYASLSTSSAEAPRTASSPEATDPPTMSIPMKRRRAATFVVGGLVLAGLGLVVFVAMQRPRKASASTNEVSSTIAVVSAAPSANAVVEAPPATTSASVTPPHVDPAPVEQKPVTTSLPKKRTEPASTASVAPAKPIVEKPAPRPAETMTSEPL